MALDFPPTDDPLSAAVTLQVPARDSSAALVRHAFTFDRVFAPGAPQGEVFEEISELVQSALDGQKVRVGGRMGAWGVRCLGVACDSWKCWASVLGCLGA